MGAIGDIAGSFALGLATPLTAACVIPLYPGFLAYLANRSEDRLSVTTLGVLVAAGVVVFMFGIGLLFTTVLEVSLTRAIGVVSPVAFGALGIASLGLMADVNVGRLFPIIEPPQSNRPVLSAFGYGFFFGGIVIPCNPGLIALFFARSLLFADPVLNVLNFLAFGLGIGAPLLALAAVSDRWSQQVIRLMTRHKTAINRTTGAIMLIISIYYLVIVFDLLGIASEVPLV